MTNSPLPDGTTPPADQSEYLLSLESLVLDETRDQDTRRQAAYALLDQGEAARETLFRAWQILQSRPDERSQIPRLPVLVRYGLARLQDQRVLPDLLRELREGSYSLEWLGKSLAGYGAPVALLLLEADQNAEAMARDRLADIIAQCSEWYSSRMLKMATESYQSNITELLGQFRDPALVPVFIEQLLKEPTDSFRDKHLARALGAMQDVRAVPALLAVLQRPSDAMLPAAEALYAIEGAVTPDVEEILMEVLRRWLERYQVVQKYGDFSYTIDILHFLAQTGSDLAVPLLVSRLSDDTTNLYQFERAVRQVRVGDMAAEALERLGSPAALAALQHYRAQNQSTSQGESHE